MRPICCGFIAAWSSEIEHEDLRNILDLDSREIAIFVPLIAVVMWMGIYPEPFLDVLHVSVEHLLNNYDAALAAHEGGATAVAMEGAR